jgi:PPOX class probable F420-dependent enzyme
MSPSIDSVVDSTPAARLSTKARQFLTEPRFAAVSVLSPDGSPLQAVIWYELEDDSIIFNSRLGRHWPANLMRDQRVSLMVADGYDYVEMRGRVEVDCDETRGLAVISELTHRYQKDPEAAAAQIAGFAREQRVTFVLRPERIFERLSD